MLRTHIIPLLLLVPTVLFGAQPSAVTLKTSAATVEYGHALTLTAIVTPAGAIGQVTFYSGVRVLETEPLSGGTATFTTTLLPYGAQPLTVYYNGGAVYMPSTSPVVMETVKTAQSRGFAAPIPTGPTYCYGPIAIGDFNGDGKPDVASASLCPGGVNVLLGNGDGSFQEPVPYVVGTGNGLDGIDVAVGDFNGDGKADLAVTYATGVSVLLGNGNGTFQPAMNSPLPYGVVEYVAIGDFNRDGRADLVVGSGAGLITLIGNGDGSFEPLIYDLNNDLTTHLLVADFNGDGMADVATLSSDGFSLLVYLGNGDGTFQSPITTVISSSSNAFALAPGDFNSDGKIDLAINTSSGVGVSLSNGDGTFQAPAYYPDNFGVSLLGAASDIYNGTIEVGDVNGDGVADIVAVVFANDYNIPTAQNDAVEVLIGNGDGTFQPPKNSPSEFTNGEYIWTALTDLNGDGKVDLVESILYVPISAQLGTLVGPTATTLTSSANPAVLGETVTITASISPAVSSGTVTFYNGSIELGVSSVKNGIATLTLSTLPVGSLYLTGVYSGSMYELASTSAALVQQVIMSPTSTTLLASPNPATVGQMVTLLAEVAPATATGNVTFYNGTAVLGTVALVNGKAKLTTSTLTHGRHALSAIYFGNSNYDPSVSATVNETVN